MDKKNPVVQCDSWIQSYCDKIHESFRFLPFFLLKSLSITCTTKPVSGWWLFQKTFIAFNHQPMHTYIRPDKKEGSKKKTVSHIYYMIRILFQSFHSISQSVKTKPQDTYIQEVWRNWMKNVDRPKERKRRREKEKTCSFSNDNKVNEHEHNTTRFFFHTKEWLFFGKLEKNSVKKNLHKDLALALHGLDIKVIIIICNQKQYKKIFPGIIQWGNLIFSSSSSWQHDPYGWILSLNFFVVHMTFFIETRTHTQTMQ